MLNETSPARRGADVLVGSIVFAIVLVMLWNGRFGENVSREAINTFAPRNVATAVENLREVRFLESNGVQASDEIKTSSRGGIIANSVNLLAVVLDTGLPTFVNIISAIGSVVITLLIISKTIGMAVVVRLIQFTHDFLKSPKRVVQVDESGEAIDVGFIRKSIESLTTDQADIGSDWQSIQDRFAKTNQHLAAHQKAIRLVMTKHDDLAERVMPLLPEVVVIDDRTPLEKVSGMTSDKLEELLALLAIQEKGKEETQDIEPEKPVRRTNARSTKKTEATK